MFRECQKCRSKFRFVYGNEILCEPVPVTQMLFEVLADAISRLRWSGGLLLVSAAFGVNLAGGTT